MSVPFIGMLARGTRILLITVREQRRNDASDADADVIRSQHRQGTGVMTWHRVGTGTSSEIVLDYAVKYVQRQVRGGVNTPPSAPAAQETRGDIPIGE